MWLILATGGATCGYGMWLILELVYFPIIMESVAHLFVLFIASACHIWQQTFWVFMTSDRYDVVLVEARVVKTVLVVALMQWLV